LLQLPKACGESLPERGAAAAIDATGSRRAFDVPAGPDCHETTARERRLRRGPHSCTPTGDRAGQTGQPGSGGDCLGMPIEFDRRFV
jgi:hypothetical protein